MLICYKQTEEKEDTEKERGDIMAENNTKELDFDRKHEEDLQRLRGLRLLDDDLTVIKTNIGRHGSNFWNNSDDTRMQKVP